MGDVFCQACGGRVDGERCMKCKREYQRRVNRTGQRQGMTFSAAQVDLMGALVSTLLRGGDTSVLVRSEEFASVAGMFARAKRRREGGGDG